MNQRVKTLIDIETVLTQEKQNEEEVINLYSIYQTYKNKTDNLNSDKENLKEEIKETLYKNFNFENVDIDDSSFDKSIRIFVTVNQKEFTIKFKNRYNPYISSVQNKKIDEEKLLRYIGHKIKRYFELIDSNTWVNESTQDIENTSNFRVDINAKCLLISSPEFRITTFSNGRDIETECSSEEVLSQVKGNETEILKNIYVMIDDCPISIQEELKNTRIKQLKQERFKRLRKVLHHKHTHKKPL